MARIFAYILHRGGVTDDSAAELNAAAKANDPTSSPTAILAGWGPDFDLACNSLTASFNDVRKVANQALAYPNAELVRHTLVRILPPESIVRSGNEHFWIDLAPGLP